MELGLLRGICKVEGSGDADGRGRDAVGGDEEEGEWRRWHKWMATPPRGEAGGTGGGGHDGAQKFTGRLGERKQDGERDQQELGGVGCDRRRAVPTRMGPADRVTGLVKVLSRFSQ